MICAAPFYLGMRGKNNLLEGAITTVASVTPVRTEEPTNVISLMGVEVVLKLGEVLEVWVRALKVTVASVKSPEGKLERLLAEKFNCLAVLS